ncbi:hypothetical protein GCM10010387_21900 [Streptomyces inusitatus]|uniref:Uncharacterized protein n=1 Tax=Streptomyces inusitatus TaxID=68221 RepID=A0A918UQF1_9ACTN|nr:DUF6243 family protein [Streptomyces inusitatus]GGZ28116.1 hypothetical protein GCM10010387_21900 [Streptomyces inusitatus]
MAKSRNNLLGVGGQRKKVSRADQSGLGPTPEANRKNAADQKAELLRKMRERAQGASSDDSSDSGSAGSAGSQDSQG